MEPTHLWVGFFIACDKANAPGRNEKACTKAGPGMSQ